MVRVNVECYNSECRLHEMCIYAKLFQRKHVVKEPANIVLSDNTASMD